MALKSWTLCQCLIYFNLFLFFKIQMESKMFCLPQTQSVSLTAGISWKVAPMDGWLYRSRLLFLFVSIFWPRFLPAKNVVESGGTAGSFGGGGRGGVIFSPLPSNPPQSTSFSHSSTYVKPVTDVPGLKNLKFQAEKWADIWRSATPSR